MPLDNVAPVQVCQGRKHLCCLVSECYKENHFGFFCGALTLGFCLLRIQTPDKEEFCGCLHSPLNVFLGVPEIESSFQMFLQFKTPLSILKPSRLVRLGRLVDVNENPSLPSSARQPPCLRLPTSALEAVLGRLFARSFAWVLHSCREYWILFQ